MSEIDKALVFALLMGDGRGIVDKSPSYMMECWNKVHEMSHPERLLDPVTLNKFKYWHSKWLAPDPQS